MINRVTIILGGGTMQHFRNHLSLCAPAYGGTAKQLGEYIPNSIVKLTKMADPTSNLETNEDVERYIEGLLDDNDIGTIVMSAALCDFKIDEFENIKSGKHAERLKTSGGPINVTLTPTDKLISKIRYKRPDIFLVGFKTTTGATSEEQFLTGLKMMKSVKCNLVLANDTVTRNNMIITAEETIYGETTNRNEVLSELADMIRMRSDLTYTPSEFIKRDESYSMYNTPQSFMEVIQFLINNGGFIENNGNGFTPGHFCWRIDDDMFVSSQRKANHNLVFSEGLSVVKVEDGAFKVYGSRKASVGARSQWMILQKYSELDCIIHTHNPLKKNSKIPTTPQKPYQCGSLECGLNTVNNMGDFGNIKAVYLDKHGANILFSSKDDPGNIIKFIKENIELGVKVK